MIATAGREGERRQLEDRGEQAERGHALAGGPPPVRGHGGDHVSAGPASPGG